MVDSPYYRPPDGAPEPEAGPDPSAEPVAPVDPAAPVEEMWEVVVTSNEPEVADRMTEDLQEAGFETWLRIGNDVDFSTGMTRVFEVLVREEQAEAAAVVAEETAVQMAEETEAFGLIPTPVGSNGCRSFVFVGGIVLLVALAVLLVALSR